MKHPLYYIIIATIADLLGIGLVNDINTLGIRPITWVLLLTAAITGMMVLSVNIYINSRRLVMPDHKQH
jgi:hypothetical protein